MFFCESDYEYFIKMETRAQRKRRQEAFSSAIEKNKVRNLRIVLKRLTKEELQIHDVSLPDLVHNLHGVNFKFEFHDFRYKLTENLQTSC